MILLVSALALALTAPPASPPGRRVDLGIDGATLFVPPGYRPAADGTVDVALHLHGAPSVVEPAFVEAGFPGVLVVFNRKGLSSVYAGPFQDKGLFPRLLDAALAVLDDRKADGGPRLKAGRVVVSSFSAGFGGVRELLKVPEHFARIDGLVLADSLYCGYADGPPPRRVDPALMDGFRRFAAEAAACRKSFLLSHSAQVPEGYASTTETADFLIHSLDPAAEPRSTQVAWAEGWTQTRSFTRGRFVVLGFSGTEGEDHMNHLRRIALLWRRFRAIERAEGP